MTRTVSLEQLGEGEVSRAISDAQYEPILVSDGDQPAAWIMGAKALAQFAEARGAESELYQRALRLLAVDLYRREILTLAHAARLAGFSLGDFIDLCGRLQVPVLWAPEQGTLRDVDALATLLAESEPDV